MARGRPVTFDKRDTLEKTLHVFWQAGYLGASYTDLCAATGLTKPSLYGAYGNKEQTFLAALDMYLDRFVHPALMVLAQEPDLREGLQNLLITTVGNLTAEGTPPGCMITTNTACVSVPDIPVAVSNALRDAAKATPNAILRRLSDAPPQSLPPGTAPESLALYFEALVSGLSGMTRQGASHEELLTIVGTAMLIWPE